MSSWKREMDKHFGEKNYFTIELERKILQKAQKKNHFKWQYPVSLLATCAVLFLLIVTAPNQKEKVVKQATPFETMIEQSSAEKFYIAGRPSSREEFLVRDSSMYLFTKGYNDREFINEFMHSMILTESVEPRYGNYTDIIVKMEDGQQLKLKVFDFKSWLGVIDLQSRLFYKVEGPSVTKFQHYIEQAKPKTGMTVILATAVIILTNLLQQTMPKLLHLPKRKKTYVNKAQLVVSIILSIGLIMGLLLLVSSSYIVHGFIVAAFAITFFGTTLLFEYIFAKEEKYYIVQLMTSVIALIIIFIMLWML
ncbi:hypothetical protein [Solibacillus sp. CAU 1738]|uniref:hypothetical protein n=1 Tax=Solibacillus sp. CAU 1738 TaxID=3140363 RepID=UPI00326118B4